nr:8861_t:CDS:2 [Entrophospora candida]
MKRHSCNSCSKNFSTQQALSNHRKTHKLKLYYDNNVSLIDLNESMAKKIYKDITKGSVDELSISNVKFTINDIPVDDNFNREFDNNPKSSYDFLDEFPDIHINEDAEYKEFMILITKHNISHSLGDEILKLIKKHSKPNLIFPISTKSGKEALDKMKDPVLNFNKAKLLEYNGIEYFFYFRTIVDAVSEIFSNKEIFNASIFNYQEVYNNNKRCYKELYNSNWWKEIEKNNPPGCKILSIILYSDKTNCDSLGKTSQHPIYSTSGNIPYEYRNKYKSKVLPGYIPILDGSKSIKKTTEFRKLVLLMFHNAMSILIKPLIEQEKDGIYLFLHGELIWFKIKISLIISDWPEACTFCLTYKTSNSSRPCYTCLTSRDQLNNMNLSNESLILRTPNQMIDIIEDDQCKDYSVHPLKNSFWKLPYLNIYVATIPEHMHHCNLGLFPYHLKYTCNLLNDISPGLLKELDSQFGRIPRFTGLKIFKNGLENISRFTAAEYRDIMKIMPFIIDNILENNCTLNKKLTDVYVKQLHHWRYHTIPSIKLFGAINGFSAETFESLHKEYIKQPYHSTNKNFIDEQMLNITTRRSKIHKLFGVSLYKQRL